MSDALPDRLIALAALVAQTDKPSDAAAEVVNRIARAVGATDVSIWLLKREESAYLPYATLGKDRWKDHVVPANATDFAERGITSSQEVVNTMRRKNPEDTRNIALTHNSTLVMGHRENTPVGFILLGDFPVHRLTGDQNIELRLCAQLLVQIYQREFSYNHLKARASQKEVDYHGSEREFFDSLIAQIAASSSMEFVALREHDSEINGLRTLAVWGFGRDVDLARFNFSPVSDYPPFARALDGKVVIAPSMEAPEFESMREKDELNAVRSFVALPIRVGQDIFGVLSVAASSEYQYNTLERRAFEGLANAAGLAILYYRSNHKVTKRALEFVEISTALTAVEVAQAARHEAIVKVANANDAISLTRKAVKADRSSVAVQRLDGLQEDVDQIEEAVNKISLALTPKVSELTEVSLKSLWNDAMKATAGKLAKAQIDLLGSDGPVLVFPDRMRQVFINLLLNSADAFEGVSKNVARKIVVRIEKRVTNGAPIVFTYRDNAGGLQLHRLHADETLQADRQVPVERLVFEKGVTSKEAGTGYGLWLANRFMQQHGGSIAVVERRGGMMFELELPDPSRIEAIKGDLKLAEPK